MALTYTTELWPQFSNCIVPQIPNMPIYPYPPPTPQTITFWPDPRVVELEAQVAELQRQVKQLKRELRVRRYRKQQQEG